MKTLGIIWFSFLVLSLFACSGSLSKREAASIQSVGIINKFPDYPAYAQIHISVHQQNYPTVNDLEFKRALSNEVADLVRQQGYTVKENFTGDASTVDLVIEIVPGKVDDLINSGSYGFYHRSLLGLMNFSKSYISLALVTKLNGKVQCNDCVGESVSEISNHHWQSNWIELTHIEKKTLGDSLKSDIQHAVSDAFSKTGL